MNGELVWVGIYSTMKGEGGVMYERWEDEPAFEYSFSKLANESTISSFVTLGLLCIF